MGGFNTIQLPEPSSQTPTGKPLFDMSKAIPLTPAEHPLFDMSKAVPIAPLPAGSFQMRKGGPVIQPGMGERPTPGVPGAKTIVPIPGEDFSDTMKRGIEAGKRVTPAQIQQA